MIMKDGRIEYGSADWVRSIPRWLARAIWDRIDPDKKTHSKKKEISRRVDQMERGRITESNRGTTKTADER